MSLRKELRVKNCIPSKYCFISTNSCGPLHTASSRYTLHKLDDRHIDIASTSENETKKRGGGGRVIQGGKGEGMNKKWRRGREIGPSMAHVDMERRDRSGGKLEGMRGEGMEVRCEGGARGVKGGGGTWVEEVGGTWKKREAQNSLVAKGGSDSKGTAGRYHIREVLNRHDLQRAIDRQVTVDNKRAVKRKKSLGQEEIEKYIARERKKLEYDPLYPLCYLDRKRTSIKRKTLSSGQTIPTFGVDTWPKEKESTGTVVIESKGCALTTDDKDSEEEEKEKKNSSSSFNDLDDIFSTYVTPSRPLSRYGPSWVEHYKTLKEERLAYAMIRSLYEAPNKKCTAAPLSYSQRITGSGSVVSHPSPTVSSDRCTQFHGNVHRIASFPSTASARGLIYSRPSYVRSQLLK